MNGLEGYQSMSNPILLGTQPLSVRVMKRSTPTPLARAAREQRKGKSMTEWRNRLLRFLSAEDGPTAVEYAVMLALIIVVCIGAITTLGNNANGVFSDVALNTAMTSSS
jgi:pilus assembly protein Flp/PilA